MSPHRVLGGHLHFPQLLRSSFWKTQNVESDANTVCIWIFSCCVKISLPVFAYVCVCVLFLPIWSCLLESLTGEWWGHISHVPRGQPQTQLSSPPVLAFSTVSLSLPALYWSMENSLKRLKKTQEKKELVVIVQQKHCFTQTGTHTLISNSCQSIKA